MTMNHAEMEVVLRHYIANLPEIQLAQLDAKLASDSASFREGQTSGLAMDQAAADPKRRDWLRLGAQARNASRQAKVTRAAESRSSHVDALKKFPHMNRLG